jgi:hypothetical protein
MPTMFVRQTVPDYERWKAVFDTMMAPWRAEYGLEVTGIFRLVDQPNTILLMLDVESVERAKQFATSAILSTGREHALAEGRTAADVWFADDSILVD